MDTCTVLVKATPVCPLTAICLDWFLFNLCHIPLCCCLVVVDCIDSVKGCMRGALLFIALVLVFPFMPLVVVCALVFDLLYTVVTAFWLLAITVHSMVASIPYRRPCFYHMYYTQTGVFDWCVLHRCWIFKRWHQLGVFGGLPIFTRPPAATW